MDEKACFYILSECRVCWPKAISPSEDKNESKLSFSVRAAGVPGIP
jgi:hypothetical protein